MSEGRIFFGCMIALGAYVLGVSSWVASSVAKGVAPLAPPVPLTHWLFLGVVGGAFALEVLYVWLCSLFSKSKEDLL